MLEMKIVLREVLTHCELAPASARPERTRRRSITISPALGGRVVLHDRIVPPARALAPELSAAAA